MKGADNNLFHHPLYSVTLSLLAAAVHFLAAAAAKNGVLSDSQQLISFKNALSNPGQLPTWQPTVSPCNFGGVDLSDFNLDTDFSTVATFLLSLGSLESLSLRNCNISGSISSAVRLSCGAALASLDLSGNAVSGPISGPISDVVPALAACPALAVLNLSRNSIDPLPHSPPRSAAVPSLQVLDLSYNNISGDGVMPWLLFSAAFPQLQHLFLQFNDLAGGFPEFSSKNLAHLDLTKNNISTALPKFSDCSALKQLDLSSYRFSGDVGDGGGRVHTTVHKKKKKK